MDKRLVATIVVGGLLIGLLILASYSIVGFMIKIGWI